MSDKQNSQCHTSQSQITSQQCVECPIKCRQPSVLRGSFMVSVASGEAIDPSPSNDAREGDDEGSRRGSSESRASAVARRRGMRERPRVPVRSSARLSTAGGSRGAQAGASPGGDGARGARSAAAKAEAARRRLRAAERAREVEDSPRVLRDKCRRLARALRNAKHLVVYTGAGISTAADIPDYRGPHGVWTRLQRGESVGRVEVSRATPTFTHMALTALWARGALKFVVSQNCDGLHLRAGLPRRALAELHGDMFAERCPACRRVYLRAFDTTERTARHAHGTRRLCHSCGAELRDTIVHFGERGRAAWPLNWAGALRHAAAADVVLCLGSSLKVLRRYPRLWRMQRAPHARPALYIVNLQWTPKDAGAALKINARCDEVMAQVARRLRLRVPRYSPRRDPLLAHAVPLAPAEAHTTRRPLLGAPPPPSPPSPASPCSSPSASDSDEELPLRRLAERLRAPEPPDLLHKFQVSLRSGDASILLRAQHAPSAGAGPPRALSELRRFRIARRPSHAPSDRANGHAPPCAPPLEHHVKSERDRPERTAQNEWTAKSERIAKQDWTVKQEWSVKQERPAQQEWTIKQEWPAKRERTAPHEATAKPERAEKQERNGDMSPPGSVETDAKSPRSSPDGGEERAESEALAAAFIARAVLLCRASLYPGLHTILAPGGAAAGGAASPGRAAECAWCSRRYAARRCLWYGPPPDGPSAARPRRGRRFLCACCGDDAPPPPAEPQDEGGWYGKGYRKGRRRRR